MIKYICDRCQNLQAKKGEEDSPMFAIEIVVGKNIHLCSKCNNDLTSFGWSFEQIRLHLQQNFIKRTK